MSAKNNCHLIGNLGDNPDYDDTKGPKNKDGKPSGLATFSMAVDRKDMGNKDDTDWFDIECWGNLAERVAEYLQKGSKVAVECRVRQNTWKDKDTGKGRSKITFTAKDVQFLDSKKD